MAPLGSRPRKCTAADALTKASHVATLLKQLGIEGEHMIEDLWGYRNGRVLIDDYHPTEKGGNPTNLSMRYKNQPCQIQRTRNLAASVASEWLQSSGAITRKS